jgi:hypothetical protein
MDVPSDVVMEFNPASAEHAILREVKTYWDTKRRSRLMPSRSDIRPSEFKKCLPQILLVDVLAGASDFRYRLVGSRLRPYFPREATGQFMSHALAPFGEVTVTATLGAYRSIVLERAPIRIKGPGTLFAQASKFFEAILMPLSDDDSHVTMIFGAFEFDWERRQSTIL